MKAKHIPAATVAALVASLCAPAWADKLSVKTGYDHTAGKYGTDIETEITSIPFILNYETGDWLFKAALPYVRIKGADNVRTGVGPISSTPTSVRTASGMGDVTLSVTRSFLLNSQTGLDLAGKVKLGTADSDKGLGTGEHDYWLLADAYTKVGAMTYFGGIGYGMLGDSPALQLKNVVSTNLGASYRLDQQSSIGLAFDTRTKSTDRGFAQREATAFYMRTLGSGYKLQGYLLKGFADGSPDWGGGLNIGYQF